MMQHALSSKVAGAFGRWYECIEKAHELRVRIGTTVTRRTTSQLAQVLLRWNELTWEAKQMRVLLQRCARKIICKTLSSAYKRWCGRAVPFTL
jgi:hypothetical protein